MGLMRWDRGQGAPEFSDTVPERAEERGGCRGVTELPVSAVLEDWGAWLVYGREIGAEVFGVRGWAK